MNHVDCIGREVPKARFWVLRVRPETHNCVGGAASCEWYHPMSGGSDVEQACALSGLWPP